MWGCKVFIHTLCIPTADILFRCVSQSNRQHTHFATCFQWHYISEAQTDSWPTELQKHSKRCVHGTIPCKYLLLIQCALKQWTELQVTEGLHFYLAPNRFVMLYSNTAVLHPLRNNPLTLLPRKIHRIQS